MGAVPSPDVLASMRSGFQELIGHRIACWEPDRVTLELDVGPQHLNLAGTVHGGVLATLIDVAASLAGLYSPDPGSRRRAMTLSLTTSFTGQASAGMITAVGHKRAGGRNIYFASVEVSNEQGAIIAMGEAVLRYRSGSDRAPAAAA